MNTCISILRGINVSGHRVIKMDALKKIYKDLGFANIHSYIQSGNIVFQTHKSEPFQLQNIIKDAILNICGFDVPVIVKDSDEMKNILSDNPFLKKKDIDVTKLHVTFLSQIPGLSYADILKEINFPPDLFVLEKDTVYLFCPDGYGNTKLNNNFFESKLKVTATTRNWKTVNELIKIAESII